MDWATLPLKRYADFSGRSRRKEYWLFVLLLIAVEIVLFIIAGILGGLSGSDGVGLFSGPGLLLFILFGLAIIVPSIAVQVRRFHDQGRSGWYVLINLVPYIGSLVVLVFMCLEGTRGPNQYGPDPKDSVVPGLA